MRIFYLTLAASLCTSACTQKSKDFGQQHSPLPLEGSWKLISGTVINGQDTTRTDYTQNQEFIKIINASHFAFLHHDLKNGKDSSAIFVAGGGRYEVEGNKYTEHLEYCSSREWENNSFEFNYTLSGDTLLITGIEKVADANVNQLNTEKYIRLK